MEFTTDHDASIATRATTLLVCECVHGRSHAVCKMHRRVEKQHCLRTSKSNNFAVTIRFLGINVHLASWTCLEFQTLVRNTRKYKSNSKALTEVFVLVFGLWAPDLFFPYPLVSTYKNL